jgi:hypothetical protein
LAWLEVKLGLRPRALCNFSIVLFGAKAGMAKERRRHQIRLRLFHASRVARERYGKPIWNMAQ